MTTPADRPLRLFVVGESSGDPEKWLDGNERAFVVAHDEKEAMETEDAGRRYGEAFEVQMLKPFMLCQIRL